MSFEYPDHPNTGRKDPFQDEDGQNPFGDDGPEAETSENPYGVPARDAGPSFVESQFETSYPHRGGRVFALGIIGLSMSFLGAVCTTACIVSQAGDGSLLTLGAALVILGLPCAWSGWMMGRNDLRAMRAGAMDDAGQRRTRRGYIMGMAGTLIAIAPVIATVVMLLEVINEQF